MDSQTASSDAVAAEDVYTLQLLKELVSSLYLPDPTCKIHLARSHAQPNNGQNPRPWRAAVVRSAHGMWKFASPMKTGATRSETLRGLLEWVEGFSDDMMGFIEPYLEIEINLSQYGGGRAGGAEGQQQVDRRVGFPDTFMAVMDSHVKKTAGLKDIDLPDESRSMDVPVGMNGSGQAATMQHGANMPVSMEELIAQSHANPSSWNAMNGMQVPQSSQHQSSFRGMYEPPATQPSNVLEQQRQHYQQQLHHHLSPQTTNPLPTFGTQQQQQRRHSISHQSPQRFGLNDLVHFDPAQQIISINQHASLTSQEHQHHQQHPIFHSTLSSGPAPAPPYHSGPSSQALTNSFVASSSSPTLANLSSPPHNITDPNEMSMDTNMQVESMAEYTRRLNPQNQNQRAMQDVSSSDDAVASMGFGNATGGFVFGDNVNGSAIQMGGNQDDGDVVMIEERRVSMQDAGVQSRPGGMTPRRGQGGMQSVSISGQRMARKGPAGSDFYKDDDQKGGTKSKNSSTRRSVSNK